MKIFLNTTDINNPKIEITETKKNTKIIKNEFGLFELHIDNELCVVKKTKKEIINFLNQTNK